MKIHKLTSILFVMAVILSLHGYVSADVQTITNIKNANPEVAVQLQAAATKFDVTVPTSIPIHVDKEITVTCPSPSKTIITNNGYGPIQVKEIRLSNGSWDLVSYDIGKSELSKRPVGKNEIGLQISLVELDKNNVISSVNDTVQTSGGDQTFELDNTKWICNHGQSLNMQFSAIVSPINYIKDHKVQDTVEFENALNMVIVIEWYKDNKN